MLFNQIEKLCNENNISPTKLCVEITGSKGNLPTWKKGNIRPDWLIKIADYFKVTTDYLLEHSENQQSKILHSDGTITVIGSKNNVANSEINSQIDEKQANSTSCAQLDEMTSELLRTFGELQFKDKVKVINFVFELQEKSA